VGGVDERCCLLLHVAVLFRRASGLCSFVPFFFLFDFQGGKAASFAGWLRASSQLSLAI
jgi:hypothetical protein